MREARIRLVWKSVEIRTEGGHRRGRRTWGPKLGHPVPFLSFPSVQP